MLAGEDVGDGSVSPAAQGLSSVRRPPLRPLCIIRPTVASKRGRYPGANKYIAEGWQKATESLGWSFIYWDGEDSDRVFEELKPDLYMADVRFRHRIPRQIRDGSTRVVVAVDQWADPIAFPDLAARGYFTRRSDVRWVRKLRPRLVHHHSSAEGLERGWLSWKTQAGIPTLSLPLAGDSLSYRCGSEENELAADVGFLGQYTQYKAPGLEEYLLALRDEFTLKIVGPGWPEGVAEASVLIDDRRSSFFRESVLNPAIHEPHGRTYGVELTERVFKVPLAGGLSVCDPVRCLRAEGFFDESEMLVAESGDQMRALVRHFRLPEFAAERTQWIEAGRRAVLQRHTYHHRLELLLRSVGLPDHADAVSRWRAENMSA